MIFHPDSWSDAAVVDLVVGGLRWTAILLGAYLLASFVASLAVHGLRPDGGGRAAAVVDALTVPAVRRVVRLLVGAGMATGAVLGPATPLAAAPADTEQVPVMRRLHDEPQPPDEPPPPDESAPHDEPSLRDDEPRLHAEPRPKALTTPSAAVPAADAPPPPADAPAAETPATHPPAADAPPPAPAAAPAAATTTTARSSAASPPQPGGEWTVRPGDHFWRIAEEVLAAHLQRTPADGDTDPYWRRLVAANRDRLVDAANPDLLFPGQVLLVPPA